MDVAVHSPAYLAAEVPSGHESTRDMCMSEFQKWPEARSLWARILAYPRSKRWDLTSRLAV